MPRGSGHQASGQSLLFGTRKAKALSSSKATESELQKVHDLMDQWIDKNPKDFASTVWQHNADEILQDAESFFEQASAFAKVQSDGIRMEIEVSDENNYDHTEYKHYDMAFLKEYLDDDLVYNDVLDRLKEFPEFRR